MTNRVAIKSCRSRIRPTLRSQIPVSKNPDQQLVKQCTGTREKSLIETSGSYTELQVWKATQTQETMRTSWCLPATSVSARTPGIAFQRQYCPKIQEQITAAESTQTLKLRRWTSWCPRAVSARTRPGIACQCLMRTSRKDHSCSCLVTGIAQFAGKRCLAGALTEGGHRLIWISTADAVLDSRY
jgi:hypothetical protein